MARILIVDDDPDVVEGCRIVLEKQGHQVLGAYNREQGMEKILSDPPDLLILDVVMQQPDDGFAMAQQLRKHDFNNPILMLTSISKVTGLTYGGRDNPMAPVDAFEEKPVSPATLIKRVEELLAASKKA